MLGELTFSGIRSSKGRHCGVGALLLKLPKPLLSLVAQSAESLGVGLDKLLCGDDDGLIGWSMLFSVQGVPGRGLGRMSAGAIRAVVVVANRRTEGKANVRGGMRIEVARW